MTAVDDMTSAQALYESTASSGKTPTRRPNSDPSPSRFYRLFFGPPVCPPARY